MCYDYEPKGTEQRDLASERSFDFGGAWELIPKNILLDPIYRWQK